MTEASNLGLSGKIFCCFYVRFLYGVICNCLPDIFPQVNEMSMKIKDELVQVNKTNTNNLMWDTTAPIFL